MHQKFSIKTFRITNKTLIIYRVLLTIIIFFYFNYLFLYFNYLIFAYKNRNK